MAIFFKHILIGLLALFGSHTAVVQNTPMPSTKTVPTPVVSVLPSITPTPKLVIKTVAPTPMQTLVVNTPTPTPVQTPSLLSFPTIEVEQQIDGSDHYLIKFVGAKWTAGQAYIYLPYVGQLYRVWLPISKDFGNTQVFQDQTVVTSGINFGKWYFVINPYMTNGDYTYDQYGTPIGDYVSSSQF